jgi:hypothetical protein
MLKGWEGQVQVSMGWGIVDECCLTKGVMSTFSSMMHLAIHQWHNCAILSSIRGSRMFSEGLGWQDVTVRARIDLWPHSFECGLYVNELQLIHTASEGWNRSDVCSLE